MQSYRKIDRFTAVFVFGRETVGFAGAGRLSRFAQQPRSGLTLTDWKRPHAQGKGAGKGRRPPPASRAVGGETGGVGAKPPHTERPKPRSTSRRKPHIFPPHGVAAGRRAGWGCFRVRGMVELSPEKQGAVVFHLFKSFLYIFRRFCGYFSH